MSMDITDQTDWTDTRGGSVEIQSPPSTAPFNRPEGTDDYNGYMVAVSQSQSVASLMGDDGERRTATIILNTPNTTVVIGRRNQVQSGNGFILPPNVPFTITTYREVCAAVPFGTADGIQRIVSVWVERNKV